MNRRSLLSLLSGVGLAPWLHNSAGAATPPSASSGPTDAEWMQRLTPQQFAVLRREATERSGTSPLNQEKRRGRYLCVGCNTPLFTSDMKFDSGTGWPSFFDALPGTLKTRTDFALLLPRTEYHCARCGGHHGHLFNDGPRPTGKRYCNNGVALKFEVTA